MFAILAATIEGDESLVVLEPSCFAVFRDEAIGLFGDRSIARTVADRAVLFDAFIGPHLERKELLPLERRALVHIHCHQQALVGTEPTAASLRAAGVDARLLDAGCCGMAGAFGFDRQHYQVSRDVGERVLLPAVRQAPPDTLIIANGFSCREQIDQCTDRKASHLAEILLHAMSRQAINS